jgi:LacI family transcriptional regulator
VFATSDGQAMGALAAARELGLAVPRDFSVIGFDGLMFTPFSTPPLTTIQTPMADMGRTAVGMIRRIAEGERLDTMRVELSTRLVVRESTAPPNAAGATRP